MIEIEGERQKHEHHFSNERWLADVPRHPFDLWTRANVGEVFPGVISPLLWSTSKESMNTSIQATLEGLKIPNLDRYRFFDLFYGRIYFNEGALVHVLSNIVGLPRSFAETSLGTRLTVPPDREAEKYHWGRIVRRLPGLLRTVSYSQSAGQKLEAAFPRIEQEARKRQEVDLATMTDEQLLQTQAELGELAQDCYQLHNSVNGMAVGSLASLQAFIERWADHNVPVNDLVTGLEGIKTAEIAPRLWRIATQIREDRALLSYLSTHDPAQGATAWDDFPQGAEIAQQIDAFLQEYGHHCTDEYEIMVPRWSQDPTFVIRTLVAYAQARDIAVSPLAFAERQRHAREAAVARVEHRLRSGWIQKAVPVRLMIFRYWLRLAQHYTWLRENGKHYLLMLTAAGRHLFVELGRRWATEGWLHEAEDIFFLEWDEIEDLSRSTSKADLAVELGPAIAARRLERARYQSLMPPDVIGAEQVLPTTERDVSGIQTLKGIGVSAGRVEGVARVILDSSQGHQLQAGDILVTRFTDPGWTPLFALASAIVMDIGGMLSHGSIVAREYGIPAVANVGVGTQAIRDGDTIVVDGSRGEVYLQR